VTDLDLRRAHRSFGNLSDEALELLATTAAAGHYEQGDVLFEADGEADEFFVVRSGIVALEMPARGAHPLVLETLGPGELVGVSWAFPPYRWNWRAVAQSEVDAIVFDAQSVRAVAQEDNMLRMALLEAVATEAIDRLHATRMRLLDIYGAAG
jgi:CRP/FNR family transcriptional regulator, cyclic AMP receptor protein